MKNIVMTIIMILVVVWLALGFFERECSSNDEFCQPTKEAVSTLLQP